MNVGPSRGVPRRIAVVLFNLGGPASPAAVEPFLFNLFYDPAIIRLPTVLRWPLARLIARRRAPVARAIYAKIGGGSPLLANSEAQASRLEQILRDRGQDARCFVAMRYAPPRAAEAAAAVRAFAPDLTVLLPLYPQFSTTTTASSFADWARAADRLGLPGTQRRICCYPALEGMVAAIAPQIRQALARTSPARVLFTAHGLPRRIVARGDPYQEQVEQTAAAIVAALAIPQLDWRVCYQSRVGPLEWIGPSTESEIEAAGKDRLALIVVPIAFVSEHSETLVELDIDYRARALERGVPSYVRVATVATDGRFMAGLATLVEQAIVSPDPVICDPGPRCCRPGLRGCGHG